MHDADRFPPCRWRKKKGYLIPTLSVQTSAPKVSEPSPKVLQSPATPSPSASPVPSDVQPQAPPPNDRENRPATTPKITISPTTSPGVSSFSLASIEKKKKWEQQQQPQRPEEHEARDPFTQADIEHHWKAYLTMKNENKEQNIVALLQLSTPKKQENHRIAYEVPSNMNKVELEREFVYFLPYLRTALNNFGVTIEVVVNESTEKQYIYTPEEKYHHLREINPNLDTLRKELDLEL